MDISTDIKHFLHCWRCTLNLKKRKTFLVELIKENSKLWFQEWKVKKCLQEAWVEHRGTRLHRKIGLQLFAIFALIRNCFWNFHSWFHVHKLVCVFSARPWENSLKHAFLLVSQCSLYPLSVSQTSAAGAPPEHYHQFTQPELKHELLLWNMHSNKKKRFPCPPCLESKRKTSSVWCCSEATTFHPLLISSCLRKLSKLNVLLILYLLIVQLLQITTHHKKYKRRVHFYMDLQCNWMAATRDSQL